MLLWTFSDVRGCTGSELGEFTFEACLLGNVEGSVAPCESVICKTTSRGVQLVEGGHAVSHFELSDSRTYSMDGSCYVVPMVEGFVRPFRVLQFGHFSIREQFGGTLMIVVPSSPWDWYPRRPP